ncbi:MAG: hypothetical protein JWN29_3965 [Acidimicrobiales bacterium]|nr:hypothetical protein [Acidimicrobiales bacterium]
MERSSGVDVDTSSTASGDPESSTTAVDPLLADITRASRDGIALVVRDRIEWVNGPLALLSGRPAAELVGQDVSVLAVELLTDGEGAQLDLTALRHHLGTRVTGNLLRAGSAPVAVAVEASRLGWEDAGWALTFREISPLLKAQEELRVAEAHFEAIASYASDGLFRSGHGAQLSYVSPRFAELWGERADALVGTTWLERVHEDDLADVFAAIERTLEGGHAECELRVRTPAGDLRPVRIRTAPVVRIDRSMGFVGSVEDLSESAALEARFRWQAAHDPLTGLANRTALLVRIEEALADDRSGTVLLHFTVDGFALVNDVLGRDHGDGLLRAVAERLVAGSRLRDVVARIGDDDFGLLLTGVLDSDTAVRLAARHLDDLSEVIRLDDELVRLTVSAGVVVGTTGTAYDLLRDADIATGQAKAKGRAGVAVFDEAVRRRLRRERDVSSGLRATIARGEVAVAYQPILATDGGRIVGAEALLRYGHPTHGPIPALEAVQLAEYGGDIAGLGRRVLATACRDLATWRRERGHRAPDYVAVNLAAAQLDEDTLVGDVLAELERHWLVGPDLCLELTESQLMTDPARAARVLTELHQLGVRIAIDDFGTGYSALSHLRHFPIDIVKLDRCFITETDGDPASAAVVRAVTTMAATLGFGVTAEGIETPDQLRWASSLGCTLAQGYALGRPTTFDAFPLETLWT